jgi:hypothetical protein
VQPSNFWYVPISTGSAPTTTIDVVTLFNPHPDAAVVTLALAGVASPVQLSLKPWEVRRLPLARLWRLPARLVGPVLLTVRASQVIAVHGEHTVLLNRAAMLRPATRWVVTAASAEDWSLWIFSLGKTPDRVQIDVRAQTGPSRRVITLIGPGRPQVVSLGRTAGGVVAATVVSLGAQPLLVVQSGPQGVLQAAVPAPATQWYFARGGKTTGDVTRLAVFNSAGRAATLTIELCRGGGICFPPQTLNLPPQLAQMVVLPPDLIAESLSATVPVVVQASVLPHGTSVWQWQEGATTLAQRWVVPGGLTLFNPSSEAARVSVQPSAKGGPARVYLVGGGARLTIDAATGVGCPTCTSTTVESTTPLVVGQETSAGPTTASLRPGDP